MSFSVTKMAPTLVSPSAPTPSGHLPFSAEDRMMPPFFVVPVVLVFRQGKKHAAAKVIREAVANALVPYYPVAGRIAADPDGELGIACTGEGVWFVEASADCRLESLGDVNLYVQEQTLFQLSKDQLLPSPPQYQNELTFMMQVTEFKCGGFTVGIIFSHAMFDGNGVGQFMVAIGEMARGLAEPTVKPVWCRDVIPRLSPGPDPNAEPPTFKVLLQSYTFDLSLDRIDQLKDKFEKETCERCTTFDIVLAIFWQCRTRAIDQQPDADVCLTTAANVRRFLRGKLLPPEGGGYYGNCLNLIVLKATAGRIANASVLDIVRLVKAAKDNVEAECSRWLKGVGGGPIPPFTYPNVLLIDWRRLGFFEADYGWGAPDYVVPLDGHPAVILNPPAPMKGIRLMTKCIAHEHFESFRSQLSEYMVIN